MPPAKLRRKPEDVARLMPTDDEIWAHHTRSWAEWERSCGLGKDVLARQFRKRGWIRGKRGACRMVKGPCSACGAKVETVEFDHRRRCGACQEEEVKDSLYRREFNRWLEENPHMMPRLQRQAMEKHSRWAMAS